MSNYDLIAFDMDGTLLNSEKQITPKTIRAMERAAEAGKIVILCTGRGYSELAPYREIIPNLRYLDCVSGAMIYDLKEEKAIVKQFLSPELVQTLLDVSKEEDVMPQLIDSHDTIINKSMMDRLDEFGMEVYRASYVNNTTKWDDVYAQYKAAPYPMAKVNLYHTSPEARLRTRARLEALNLPVSFADAEMASLEVSAAGVNKGSGLAMLCRHLQIPIERTIAVGDSYNDLDALRTAGLAVAVANAKEAVKQAADVIVADNDHDGCAEAIERYLL